MLCLVCDSLGSTFYRAMNNLEEERVGPRYELGANSLLRIAEIQGFKNYRYIHYIVMRT